MNIQKQQSALQISQLFKKFTETHGQITREFLGLRMRNLQGVAFI